MCKLVFIPQLNLLGHSCTSTFLHAFLPGEPKKRQFINLCFAFKTHLKNLCHTSWRLITQVQHNSFPNLNASILTFNFECTVIILPCFWPTYKLHSNSPILCIRCNIETIPHLNYLQLLKEVPTCICLILTDPNVLLIILKLKLNIRLILDNACYINIYIFNKKFSNFEYSLICHILIKSNCYHKS